MSFYDSDDSSSSNDDTRRGDEKKTKSDGEREDDGGGRMTTALGVLGGAPMETSIGALGASIGRMKRRDANERSTQTIKDKEERTHENPFEANERERERDRERLGVTFEDRDDARARPEAVDENTVESIATSMRDIPLDGTRSEMFTTPKKAMQGSMMERTAPYATSPPTPSVGQRSSSSAALANGGFHADGTLSYGDLLAPPPSYADSVMYTQPEIQPMRGHRDRSGDGVSVFLGGQGEDEVEGGTLQIWVTDPKIEAEVGGSLVGKRVTHYKITTRTTIPSYIQKEAIVWRRFRDFVGLADRLSVVHRGLFVPPRPEKTVVNSTEDNFVQERATQLQQYLVKISTHPVLRHGNPLRIFLTHQDLGASVEWFNMTTRIVTATIPASPEAPQRPPLAISSPGQSRDFGRFFKELRQTVVQSTAVTAVGGALGLETVKPKVMEEDASFLVEKDKVLKYEQELSTMSQKATKMLTLQQKFGEAIGEFGMECLKFARLQEEEGARLGKYSENGMACMTGANEMRKAGNTSVKVGRLARTATAQTAQSLEPLHDYLKLMPSVRKSVADRNESLLTLQTVLADGDRLDLRIAKLTPDLTKMRKVEELKFELERTRALCEAARNDYNEIQERHREEFSRLEKERVAQFHEMMLSHARVQVANAERSLSLWRGLAEEFGARASEWTSPKAEPVDEGELS